ncbi:hypothetical protein Nepgr_030073 [Nepenthes gracilis]|uniref:Uncharacterized protein n=1 Tax=Nepenthes gracilis TaxID=150966 RepID=A0AAD3Y5H3_NEPGR|nr:hypothetical protein Nepgr_030073 [Nepenthes gracilis]
MTAAFAVLLLCPVLQFLDAVSLKGFAGQSTLDVLHCRVLMPTGLIRLLLILMWVVTDAGVHVALELLLDSVPGEDGQIYGLLDFAALDAFGLLEFCAAVWLFTMLI